MRNEYLQGRFVSGAVRSLSLVALIAVPAFAQTIYSWEEKDGTHYTDDVSKVPKQKKVEERTVEARPVAAKQPAATTGTPAVPAAAPAPAPAGTKPSEGDWRDRFITAHRRIDSLKRDIAALEASLPPRTECVPQTTGINTFGTGGSTGVVGPNGQVLNRCQVNPLHDRIRVQIAERGVELKDAELDLEQLDRRASEDAVPREWRRGW